MSISPCRARHPHPESCEGKDLRRRGLRVQALDRARTYIEQNLFCSLRLDGVASAAGVSRYHFSRCFTMSMGVTFVEYVAQRRIAAARAQLDQDPNTDLASLAVELGFCDQAHFSNVFRRFSGTTPKRYANQSSRHSGESAASRRQACNVAANTNATATGPWPPLPRRESAAAALAAIGYASATVDKFIQ